MAMRVLLYVMIILLIGYGISLVIQGTKQVEQDLINERTADQTDAYRPESIAATVTSETGGNRYVGTIALPNPCYRMETAVLVGGGGKQVRLDFTASPTADACIQVIDERPFSIWAERARAGANVTAYFNGKKVLLLLNR